MLIPAATLSLWLWIVPIIGYTWAPRTWVAGELVTSAMMNGIRDLFNAIRDYFFPRQTFRGLVLQTHPDADVAAGKVMLVHADEITLNDGEKVTDVGPLVADITVAGAGGLDTGAEAASTPYEVYYIRKSADGSEALLFHKARDYFADEVNTTHDSDAELREGATTNVKIGQTFDTDETGPLAAVELLLNKQGSPTGRMWIELYATAAGAPTGAALATSDKLDVASLTSNNQTVRFLFRSPATLTAGTTYAIAIAGDYAASATVNVRVRYNSASVYAAGSRYNYDGTNWASAAQDLYFRVYVLRSTDLTLPSGYDQYCLLNPGVYNNGSSNFRPFLQRDRSVRHEAVTVSSGLTNTYATLTDLSTAVPPVPVTITHAELSNTTAGSACYVYPTWNSQFSNAGLFFWHSPRGGDLHDVDLNLLCEAQHCYLLVGANAGTFTFGGWRF